MANKTDTWMWRSCTDVCPCCGSGGIAGEMPVVEGTNVVRERGCVRCGSTWYDVYVLEQTRLTQDCNCCDAAGLYEQNEQDEAARRGFILFKGDVFVDATLLDDYGRYLFKNTKEGVGWGAGILGSSTEEKLYLPDFDTALRTALAY